MMKKIRGFHPFTLTKTIACLSLLHGLGSSAHAAAYASGVSIQNTTVTFTLNEPADSLWYSINGGPMTFLDGTTKGSKNFSLGSASDTFSISAYTNDAVGYKIATGGTIAAATNGLSQSTAEAGFNLISDDTNNFVRFNSPRGVAVATNPNNPWFGTSYISNSGVATTGRLISDGLFAIKADQSDAFGYADAARPTGFETGTNSGNSPFRVSVGPDHNVYIADFSDAYGGLYRMSGTLTSSDPFLGSTQVFSGVGGASTLPSGQNHGSLTAVYVAASASGLTIYTLDEDLNSGHVAGAAPTGDKNSLWRYDIDSTATLPYDAMPTKLATTLVSGATSDMDVGLDGKFYLAQNRSAGGEAGLKVVDSDGVTVLFSSLTESGGSVDILRNVLGVAVSPDQKYVALILNNSDVAVIPLGPDGIPLLANRMVINTGTDINSGRDIAFDAAGNIHYVSSGQGLYRVLSPGGISTATTSWDGTSYSFSIVPVPEPSSALLVGMGATLLARRRRRS